MNHTLIHNDEPAKIDLLNRSQYARAFAELAQICETPLVIGLYGPWGIGKTTMMQQIRASLEQSNVKTVWFDPWQNQFNDYPAVSLLQALVESIENTRTKTRCREILADIARAFSAIMLSSATELGVDIKTLFAQYEEDRFRARSIQAKLKDYFEELIRTVHGKLKDSRIVFFIDDLDRCMPETVLKVLESLKLYLNLPNCVYFLAVDKLALERSIEYHYQGIGTDHVHYLDKMVQLPFFIPPIASDCLTEFINALLSPPLQICVDLLVIGLGENPRQIKRFINTLTLNHLLMTALDPRYDPRILTFILLIQYLDTTLYQKIANQPELLMQLQRSAKSVPIELQPLFKRIKISPKVDLSPYIFFTNNHDYTQQIIDTDQLREKLDGMLTHSRGG